MNTIRTTMQPDVELEVDDRELTDLEAQGLVLHTKATTDEGARRAAENQTESKEN
jgi:hypothetical protein